jgi:outer membrane protein OmpU
MNKILLATTAAAALAVFSAPASAQITVKLGGFVNFEAGFWDEENATGRNDREFRNDTEVHVRADGKADNGLLYGVQIEIDSSGTALNYDEANLYLAGSWGRIELGDQDGASEQLSIYAPVVGIGQVDGDYADFVGELGDVFLNAPDSSDATKATYFTPTFAGFRAGVSYATESNGGDSVVLTEPTTGYSDWIEAGVNYSGEFSGFSVALSGTYSQADGNGLANEDFSAWQAGAQVGFAGFTVGGSYVDLEDFAYKNAWNVGATYATGPFGVGVSYSTQEGEDGVQDIDLISVGGTYTLAPGVALQADYYNYEFSGNGLEGDLVILSTKVTF